MLSVLSHRTYRHLFFAQVVALLGTGLATVALALLAYHLAGEDAGQVLGTALAIKMIAYVGVAQVASALAARLPRQALLVSLDLVRAAIALMLPFVTQIWQVYLLIFLLQSASAAFTPAFQATLPDILADEDDYTKALSLSRLAYDLESLVSPALAAALLTVMAFHFLFAGTALGFVGSAALILSTAVPGAAPARQTGVYDRVTRGLRIYLATPRLRGLLAVNLAVAAAGAMVIVNTVVYVQGTFGLGQRHTALALAAFGAGSMLAALVLPRLLHRVCDRSAMLAGTALLAAMTLLASALQNYLMLLALWPVIGAGYSLAQVPSGRLLRRSAQPQDRPALFAAQFTLSHACWLVTYPLAGWLGSVAGLSATATVLAAIATTASAITWLVWPVPDAAAIAHGHPDLPHDHPHLAEGRRLAPARHSHTLVIDDLHRRWPLAG